MTWPERDQGRADDPPPPAPWTFGDNGLQPPAPDGWPRAPTNGTAPSADVLLDATQAWDNLGEPTRGWDAPAEPGPSWTTEGVRDAQLRGVHPWSDGITDTFTGNGTGGSSPSGPHRAGPAGSARPDAGRAPQAGAEGRHVRREPPPWEATAAQAERREPVRPAPTPDPRPYPWQATPAGAAEPPPPWQARPAGWTSDPPPPSPPAPTPLPPSSSRPGEALAAELSWNRPLGPKVRELPPTPRSWPPPSDPGPASRRDRLTRPDVVRHDGWPAAAGPAGQAPPGAGWHPSGPATGPGTGPVTGGPVAGPGNGPVAGPGSGPGPAADAWSRRRAGGQPPASYHATPGPWSPAAPAPRAPEPGSYPPAPASWPSVNGSPPAPSPRREVTGSWPGVNGGPRALLPPPDEPRPQPRSDRAARPVTRSPGARTRPPGGTSSRAGALRPGTVPDGPVRPSRAERLRAQQARARGRRARTVWPKRLALVGAILFAMAACWFWIFPLLERVLPSDF
jgi:hypothetical protein